MHCQCVRFCGEQYLDCMPPFNKYMLFQSMINSESFRCDGPDELDKVDQCPDTDDPMDELVLNEKPSAPKAVLLSADANGRARYYTNKAKHFVVSVNTPSRPPEIDPNCMQMRPIRLYIEDRMQVWLHVDDVAWAVEYLFHQVRLKGVPKVEAHDRGPSHAAVTTISV